MSQVNCHHGYIWMILCLVVGVWSISFVSVFAATLTVSGTLYQEDRISSYATSSMITLVLATSTPSTYSTSTVPATGNFSFSITTATEVPTSTLLLVYLDGEVHNGVTVFKKAVSAMYSEVPIYVDHVTTYSISPGYDLRASELTAYDRTKDNDILYTASSTLGQVLLEDNVTFLVATSSFVVDELLDADDLMINSTGKLAASTSLNIRGDFIQTGSLRVSEEKVSWLENDPLGTTSVMYGPSIGTEENYVLIGEHIENGTDYILHSTDGMMWSTSTSPSDGFWTGLAYGSSTFVAVGYTGNRRVLHSLDGITWTAQRALDDNDLWLSVTYGNGLFVAVGDCNSGDCIMTSPDGITWTARTAAEANGWTSVTYGNGLFVAVADSGTNRVMTSPDGITWTARSAAGNDDVWYDVTYGNGLFVAVGTGPDYIMISQDGVSWSSVLSPVIVTNPGVLFHNDLFVIIDGGGQFLISTNGERWYQFEEALFNSFNSAGTLVGYEGVFIIPGVSGRIYVGALSFMDMAFVGTSAQVATGTFSGLNKLSNLYFDGAGSKTFGGTASATQLYTATSSGAVTFNEEASFSGNYSNFATTSFQKTIYFDGVGNQSIRGGWSGIVDLHMVGDGIKNLLNVTTTSDLVIASSVYMNLAETLVIVDDLDQQGVWNLANSFWTTRTAAESNAWRSVTYGNGLFVAVANTGTNRVMTSPDGITWTARSAAAANQWNSVTYGNGLFVAVANTGTNRVMTSPDGITWTARTAAGNNDLWLSVTYGNGLFVAVGAGPDRVMTSPDGITWTARTAAEANGWTSVTYGNGLFVAVADSGTNRVMTSPDGITWTARTAAEANGWSSVAYGNGLFVAVANTGTNRIMTSPDGITWTARFAPQSWWRSVTFGNGVFVAVGDTGSNLVMTSTDGITWSGRADSQVAYWTSVVSGNGVFVAVAEFGTNLVMTSPVWSDVIFSGATTQDIRGNLVGSSTLPNTYFVGVGQKIFYDNASTTDVTISGASTTVRAPAILTVRGDYVNEGVFDAGEGIIVFETEPGQLQTLSGYLTSTHERTIEFHTMMIAGGGIIRPNAYVRLGGSLNIATGTTLQASSTLEVMGDFIQNGNFLASDVATWTPQIALTDLWNSVAYGRETFVAVAYSGTGTRVMTSPDGITWTARAASEMNEWQAVTFGGDQFVAVASSGTNRVMTSPDGITWTARSAAEASAWRSVVYGSGLFVAIADSGTNRVMTSPDGITWTARSAAEANAWRSVTYGNGLFVAVAFTGTNRVMTSPDGITWTARSAAAANQWNSVAYGNGLFVAVAQTGTNRVMTSPDGITWTARSAAEVNAWFSVTYGGGLFVAVAYTGTNRVMTSPDGITWTARAAAAQNSWLSVTYGNGLFVAAAVSGTNRVMTSHNVSSLILSGTTSQTISGTLVANSDLPILIFKGSGTKLFTSNASTSSVTIEASSGTVILPSYMSLSGQYTNRGLVWAPEYFNLQGTNQVIDGDWLGSPDVVMQGGIKTFARPVSFGSIVVGPNADFVTPTTSAVMGNYTNTGTSSQQYALWSPITPPEANAWFSVTYGNGLFVAVAYTGTNRVMTSPDGITWTARTAAEANSWTSVTYGNDLFVAVSADGTNRVMTSPDGITWTARSAAAANQWYSVTYGSGLFVAVAIDGTNRVMTSPDGITWTARSAAGANTWLSVTYGNSLFVAVADSGTNRVMTSPDGITWTARTAAEANGWSSVAYGNGLFVAVASTGTNRVMTSSDGITWTARVAAEANLWRSVTYGNDLFVAVAQTGTNRVMTSPDGITWTARYSLGNDVWRSVAFGEDRFVAVADSGTYRVMNSVIATQYFSGTSLQTVAGNFTGQNALGHIVIDGTGGVEFTSIASSTSILLNTTATTTFGAALTVSESLRAEAGAKIELAASATSSVGRLQLLGTAGEPIIFQSTLPGTEANFVLTGSSTVMYTRLADNQTCGSTVTPIDVSGNNNIDGGNLQCWNFLSLVPVINFSAPVQFYVGQATTTLPTVTVTDADYAATITTVNDIRLSVATATFPFRFNQSITTLSYEGTASGKVSTAVTYDDGGATVIIPVTTNFSAGDVLRISGLEVGSFTTITPTTEHLRLYTGGVSIGVPQAETSVPLVVTGQLIISDHPEGQPANQFTVTETPGAVLYRFAADVVGESATISELAITLLGISEVAPANFSGWTLVRDLDEDGTVSGGDVVLDAAGILTISGSNGTVTFNQDIVATTSHSYLVTATTTALARGTAMSLMLEPARVVALGALSSFSPVIQISSGRVQHERYGSGAGGIGSEFGGGAPAGGSPVGGGGSDGGTGIDPIVPGDNFAEDPNYRRPTAVGTPSDWQSPTNAFHSDGVYATTTSLGTSRQVFRDFGLSIPSGNTIQGIAVRVDASGANMGGVSLDPTLDVSLSWDGGGSYTTAKVIGTIVGNDVIFTIGSPSDLWGRTWSTDNLSNTNFRLRVTMTQDTSVTEIARLDAVEVRVYHQVSGGSSAGGGAF